MDSQASASLPASPRQEQLWHNMAQKASWQACDFATGALRQIRWQPPAGRGDRQMCPSQVATWRVTSQLDQSACTLQRVEAGMPTEPTYFAAGAKMPRQSSFSRPAVGNGKLAGHVANPAALATATLGTTRNGRCRGQRLGGQEARDIKVQLAAPSRAHVDVGALQSDVAAVTSSSAVHPLMNTPSALAGGPSSQNGLNMHRDLQSSPECGQQSSPSVDSANSGPYGGCMRSSLLKDLLASPTAANQIPPRAAYGPPSGGQSLQQVYWYEQRMGPEALWQHNMQALTEAYQQQVVMQAGRGLIHPEFTQGKVVSQVCDVVGRPRWSPVGIGLVTGPQANEAMVAVGYSQSGYQQGCRQTSAGARVKVPSPHNKKPQSSSPTGVHTAVMVPESNLVQAQEPQPRCISTGTCSDIQPAGLLSALSAPSKGQTLSQTHEPNVWPNANKVEGSRASDVSDVLRDSAGCSGSIADGSTSGSDSPKGDSPRGFGDVADVAGALPRSYPSEGDGEASFSVGTDDTEIAVLDEVIATYHRPETNKESSHLQPQTTFKSDALTSQQTDGGASATGPQISTGDAAQAHLRGSTNQQHGAQAPVRCGTRSSALQAYCDRRQRTQHADAGERIGALQRGQAGGTAALSAAPTSGGSAATGAQQGPLARPAAQQQRLGSGCPTVHVNGWRHQASTDGSPTEGGSHTQLGDALAAGGQVQPREAKHGQSTGHAGTFSRVQDASGSGHSYIVSRFLSDLPRGTAAPGQLPKALHPPQLPAAEGRGAASTRPSQAAAGSQKKEANGGCSPAEGRGVKCGGTLDTAVAPLGLATSLSRCTSQGRQHSNTVTSTCSTPRAQAPQTRFASTSNVGNKSSKGVSLATGVGQQKLQHGGVAIRLPAASETSVGSSSCQASRRQRDKVPKAQSAVGRQPQASNGAHGRATGSRFAACKGVGPDMPYKDAMFRGRRLDPRLINRVDSLRNVPQLASALRQLLGPGATHGDGAGRELTSSQARASAATEPRVDAKRAAVRGARGQLWSRDPQDSAPALMATTRTQSSPAIGQDRQRAQPDLDSDRQQVDPGPLTSQQSSDRRGQVPMSGATQSPSKEGLGESMEPQSHREQVFPQTLPPWLATQQLLLAHCQTWRLVGRVVKAAQLESSFFTRAQVPAKDYTMTDSQQWRSYLTEDHNCKLTNMSKGEQHSIRHHQHCGAGASCSLAQAQSRADLPLRRDPKGRVYPHVWRMSVPRQQDTVAFLGLPGDRHEAGLLQCRIRLHVRLGLANSAIRLVFKQASFRATSSRTAFNVLWGPVLPAKKLRCLAACQRVNHFLGTWELGRKDRLYRNLQRMRSLKGSPFDIFPPFYILPAQYKEYRQDCARNPGRLFITKPLASSCGRGIRVVPASAQLLSCRSGKPRRCIAQHYLHDPLLIDGYKCDMRVYVAVTCYEPLKAYLYEEGIVRFATEKYRTNKTGLSRRCMHLTNFSVNKKAAGFVQPTADEGPWGRCEDGSQVEDQEGQAGCMALDTRGRAALSSRPHSSGTQAQPTDFGHQQLHPCHSSAHCDVPGALRDHSPTILCTQAAGQGQSSYFAPLVQHAADKQHSAASTATSAGMVTQQHSNNAAATACAEDALLVHSASPQDRPPGPRGMTATQLPARAASKWTLQQLRTHLESRGVPWSVIWAQVHDIVAAAVISAEPRTSILQKLYQPGPDTCFEVYGLDILLDSHYRAWLLEANTCPALNCGSDLDRRVKYPMLRDLLHMVGVPAVDLKQESLRVGRDKAGARRQPSKLRSCVSENRGQSKPRRVQDATIYKSSSAGRGFAEDSSAVASPAVQTRIAIPVQQLERSGTVASAAPSRISGSKPRGGSRTAPRKLAASKSCHGALLGCGSGSLGRHASAAEARGYRGQIRARHERLKRPGSSSRTLGGQPRELHEQQPPAAAVTGQGGAECQRSPLPGRELASTPAAAAGEQQRLTGGDVSQGLPIAADGLGARRSRVRSDAQDEAQALHPMIAQAEAELSRGCGWERVFPCLSDPDRYLEWFEQPKAANVMLTSYYKQKLRQGKAVR